MRRSTLYFLIILTVAILASAPPASSKELIVSAAASLTDAFSDIEPAFEAEHPGVDVVMNFASSGALYRQIEQGAPVDVFASANPKWMDKAVAGGFADKDMVRVFARNALVLAAPLDNPAGVTALNDLTKAHVGTIGIGSPATVPAGQYAKSALMAVRLFEPLTQKYIFCDHVRQVLDYLARGEVDAGFVYRTDAVKAADRVAIIAEVPLDTPVTYPIAPLDESGDPALAQAFVDFTLGPGAALLEARGFKRP